MSVGDLLEGIILHAFEGAAPFGPDSREKIRVLRDVYGLDLEAKDSHLLVERSGGDVGTPRPRSQGRPKKRT
jgi:hypothetical protein